MALARHTRIAFWPCACGAFGRTMEFHCSAGHRRDEMFVAGYRRGQEALRNRGAARSADERKRYEDGVRRGIEDALLVTVPDGAPIQ